MNPLQGAIIVGVIALLALYSKRGQAAVYQPGVSYDPVPNDEPAPGWVFNGWEYVPDFASAPYANTDTGPDFVALDPAITYDDTDAGDFAQPVGDPFGAIMSEQEKNLAAFLSVIRYIEADAVARSLGVPSYNVIAGGDAFTDYSEHPFILNPSRRRPLGTTASGAYQQVVGTWKMARDALGLTDFSPASQDAAAVWILQTKRPRSYSHVLAGNFTQAARELVNEWEAFKKMLAGAYPITMEMAANHYTMQGGTLTA